MMRHATLYHTDSKVFDKELDAMSNAGWSVHTFRIVPGQAAMPMQYVALMVQARTEARHEGMGMRDKPLAAK